MMPLRLADLNMKYEVARIGGNAEVKQHLADMGFHAGAQIEVVSRCGESMIVCVKGARVALGRELAGKIYV